MDSKTEPEGAPVHKQTFQEAHAEAVAAMQRCLVIHKELIGQRDAERRTKPPILDRAYTLNINSENVPIGLSVGTLRVAGANVTVTVDDFGYGVFVAAPRDSFVRVRECVLPPGHQALFLVGRALDARDTSPISELDAKIPDSFEDVKEVEGLRMAMPGDRNGNGPGGAYISPYRFEWRSTPRGYANALSELQAVVNRMAVSFHDERGIFTSSQGTALVHGYDRPDGWRYNGVDAIDAGCSEEYLSFRNFDGQHFIRAYAAALHLRHLNVAKHYLRCLANYIELAWGVGSTRAGTVNPSYFGIDRWLDELRAGKRLDCCGREFAHVARFFWTFLPSSELSELLEEAVRISSDFHWTCFGSSDVQYSKKSRKALGGPFLDNEPVVMSREAYLLAAAMELRPGLSQERARLLNWLGVYAPETVALSEERSFRFRDGFGRCGWTGGEAPPATGEHNVPGSMPYELFFGAGNSDEIREQGKKAPYNVVHQPLDHMPYGFARGVFGDALEGQEMRDEA